MVSSTERPTDKSLTVICLQPRDQLLRMYDGAKRHPRIPDDAFGVDNEKTSERDTLFLDEDIVITRDAHVPVRDQSKFQIGSETTLLPRLLSPSKVRVLRICRDTC